MAMDPVIGSAIVGAGAQLLGSVFGAAGSSNLNYRTRQHQYFMLQRQQEYNDKVNSQQMAYQDKINAENRAYQDKINAMNFAYQDKVNAESYAWNDESAKRARIEAAGYNPYLYDNATAMSGSAASGSGVAGSGVNLSPGSASLPGALPGNPLGSLGAGIGAAASTFQQFMAMGKQMEAQDIANDSNRYQFNRMVDNDNVTIDGHRAYFSTGMQSIYHIEDARAQANISSIKAFNDTLLKLYNEAPAVDENGQPILDGEGNPVSNFNVEQNARKDQALLAVQRIGKDLLKMDKEIENLDVDKLIKKYKLEKLMPAELEQIRSSLAVMLSQIHANNASAASSIASAASSWADAGTKNALRPYQVGTASWDNQGRKFSALNERLKYNSDLGTSDWYYKHGDDWWMDVARGVNAFGPALGGTAFGVGAHGLIRGVRSSVSRPKSVKGFKR